ncbi:hypothetical protein BN1708_015634 [Verticillium longisporum]|uniref:J domain-containing protein n=1 Tax=Verticillium longisporum TaxID=100787 RepID=A0A0G4M667_VERLO|nr:hypothetical protein BN1708_015634 [Verticillium longisporum]
MYHADKKAPGKSINVQEFRKAGFDIREAYECLRDKARRLAYDEICFDLQDQWAR